MYQIETYDSDDPILPPLSHTLCVSLPRPELTKTKSQRGKSQTVFHISYQACYNSS